MTERRSPTSDRQTLYSDILAIVILLIIGGFWGGAWWVLAACWAVLAFRQWRLTRRSESRPRSGSPQEDDSSPPPDAPTSR